MRQLPRSAAWPANRGTRPPLENGANLQASGEDFENPWDARHLERGRDFDAVLLGLPPAVRPTEAWPAGQAPRSCEYLCGTFAPSAPAPAADAAAPGHVESQNREVERIGRTWLDTNAAGLWPNAVRDGRFDWQQSAGVYRRANVAWSELYARSLRGITQYRLAPGGSGFDNLFLAGDRTSTSINGGCAEAAFESACRRRGR
jgi:hypothetical protein